jgi:predicted transcriptional regulator
MKYRSRKELIAQILETANGNKVGITKITVRTRIPYNLLKRYLTAMIEKDLIQRIEGTGVELKEEEKPTYKTTEKGLYFLKLYNELIELMIQSSSKKSKQCNNNSSLNASFFLG